MMLYTGNKTKIWKTPIVMIILIATQSIKLTMKSYSSHKLILRLCKPFKSVFKLNQILQTLAVVQVPHFLKSRGRNS